MVTVLDVLLKFDLISDFVIERVRGMFASSISGTGIVLTVLAIMVLLYLVFRYFIKKYKFRLLRWGLFRKMIILLNGFRKGFRSEEHPSELQSLMRISSA